MLPKYHRCFQQALTFKWCWQTLTNTRTRSHMHAIEHWKQFLDKTLNFWQVSLTYGSCVTRICTAANSTTYTALGGSHERGAAKQKSCKSMSYWKASFDVGGRQQFIDPVQSRCRMRKHWSIRIEAQADYRRLQQVRLTSCTNGKNRCKPWRCSHKHIRVIEIRRAANEWLSE